ncbi:penicillin-binding protein activator [uncultured Enterovirga sp.]|uniref:penicillin-binding protein activator n=1 Tax=uncultured Enterovirga sp. TaxID=2026352 RepID=UPI0035CAA9D0
MTSPPILRRTALAGGALVAITGLVGCNDRRLRADVGPLTEAPPPTPSAPASSGVTIGMGSVKVALILPLTGPGQGAIAGQSLRNAAELAMTEFQGADVTILVKDDKGTAEGAREAANAALAEGAELVIGPLFAPAVSAAGQVARAAGKPVIAFSTDTTIASRGVYLLSFTPQPEVERVVSYATGQGRRSFAALIPESYYGNVVEGAFREAAAKSGARVVAVERYASGQPGPAVQRLTAIVSGDAAQADAIFIPDSGESLAAVGTALGGISFNPGRVKPLGTGVWNDPRATRIAALQGGWYAAPDQAGFAAFSGRYRAKFGSEPSRIATLSYDAVSLVVALARTQGPGRFSDSVLLGAAGFSGVDGTFRFRSDGGNDRTLAVLELRDGTTGVVSPAPKTLGAA